METKKAGRIYLTCLYIFLFFSLKCLLIFRNYFSLVVFPFFPAHLAGKPLLVLFGVLSLTKAASPNKELKRCSTASPLESLSVYSSGTNSTEGKISVTVDHPQHCLVFLGTPTLPRF